MSQNSYVVQRMDLLTRKSYPRNKLVRLVLVEGKLTLDLDNKLQGRGIYFLKDKDTIEKVFSKGVLKRFSKSTDFVALAEEVKKTCLIKNS